jgi:GT2 family glycosyltransferase
MGGHISPEGTQVVEEPFEAEFATGCGMLVKKEVFETVGFFDEDYFVYCEDADFSFRARSAGFRIVHVPSALTWHHQSMDTKRNQGKWYRDYYVTRNKLLLVSKQTKGFRWLLFLGYFAVNQVFVPTLYYVLTAQFRRSAAIVLAVSDFISRRFGKRYA